MPSVKHDSRSRFSPIEDRAESDRLRPMPNAHSHFSGDYSSWLGQWVVLKVVTGKSQTELVCTVIAESDAALRIRIAEICEVDIYKDMILGVAQAWPVESSTYRDLAPAQFTSGRVLSGSALRFRGLHKSTGISIVPSCKKTRTVT